MSEEMPTLRYIREALHAEHVRLELDSMLSLTRGIWVPSAVIMIRREPVREGGRRTWTNFPRTLVAPEHDMTRAGLLRMIGEIAESTDE